MRNHSKSPDRIKILNCIFEHLQQVSQWGTDSASSYIKHLHFAEALIELLEENDCGSIGGFDKNNPLVKESESKLYNRFLTLINKYNNKKDIESICGFTIDSLKAYFDATYTVRDFVLEGGQLKHGKI